MQLRLHLTDESFLERRSALRHLDGAPFALVRELMPEILYCLNCDDEEAQVISRALVKRHLVEPETAAHAAGTVGMRGLAAHGLLGVLRVGRTPFTVGVTPLRRDRVLDGRAGHLPR